MNTIDTIKNLIPEDIKTLIKRIDTYSFGYDVYLGGGYLRDLYTGKRPKDIDLFFVPTGGNPAEYIPEGFMVSYRKDREDIDMVSDMEQRGVAKLIGLWTSKIQPQEVQYIVYDKYLTMAEVAEDFDMNICQVVYCPYRNEVFFTEAFIEGHNEKKIECLHSYDQERTIARYNRMMKKFDNYKVIGYPEPEEIEDEYADVGGLGIGIKGIIPVKKQTSRRSHSGSV